MNKNLILIILISFLLISFRGSPDNSAYYSKHIEIKNNEVFEPNYEFYSSLIEKYNINLFPSKLNSSVIIKSLETDSCKYDDLLNFINKNNNLRFINYYNILSSSSTISDPTYSFKTNDNEYDWRKIKGLPVFYHNLFQNKTARRLLFNNLLEYVCFLCENYPIDFKKNVLNEINSMIKFTGNIENYNEDNISPENYWKGFIYRRVYFDKVPLLEINSFLTEAKSKISSINETSKSETMIKLIINNNITISLNSQFTKLSSSNSINTEVFPASFKLNSITYLEDETGGYYLVKGNKNFFGDFEYKKLYDSKLNPME